MGRWYKQLSLEDRCEIARLQADGCSVRQIASALDRSASTISRELRRNRGREVGYKPRYAQEQTRARRWAGSRLERDPALRRAVFGHLAQGWSPEQVAGRMAHELGRKVISYESIYRFIYAQIARTKDYRWRRYLPRGKSKRGFRGRRGGSSATFIKARIPVSKRPPSAAGRKVPGHWEADLMLFQIRSGRAHRARAQVAHLVRHQAAHQGCQADRAPPGPPVLLAAKTAAPDHHVRQRDRVCSP